MVREFYRLNHTHQTRDFVLAQEARVSGPRARRRWASGRPWSTSTRWWTTAIRIPTFPRSSTCSRPPKRFGPDGHPRWFLLTGLIHDLGKILCLWGEPQWAVVGDTFPVGCAWSDKIVFPEFFRQNPDANVPEYQTRSGVYEEGCGLDRVDLSWGHDEYLYHVVRTICRSPRCT